MSGIVRIDGGRGEGGGQVLRTALTLSVLTGSPFRIVNVRASRPNPGLAPQHLHAVRLMREISGGRCKGDRQGSTEVCFTPGALKSGDYTVDVGTAGAVTLLLQTVALPLSLAEGDSRLTLVGGTHVPWSPTFDYLTGCWLPSMSRLGVHIEARLERAGFYPRGGGRVIAEVRGKSRLEPLRLTERGELKSLEVIAGTSRLPAHIRNRQASRAQAGVQSTGRPTTVQLVELPGGSPGSFVAIHGHFTHTSVCATALGARGKSAESVGQEAASDFLSYWSRSGALDRFLPDQLIVPLAMAEGRSELTTVSVTRHLQTNAAIIASFLERTAMVDGDLGEPGRLVVS